MSSVVRKFPERQARPQRVPRVLYLGPAADELCNLLAPQIGRLDIAYHTDVQAALEEARASTFDMVLVDQRDARLASQLILPLLSAIGYPIQLVVISSFADVSHYLAVPGVARVLSAPLREAQLLRVIGLERRAPRGRQEEGAAPEAKEAAAKKKGIFQLLSDRFMSLVSNLYKRAAFVLLFSLFIAFTFYGVLIGFFLMSSGWGAPMTLTRGHELVNKAERDLTEMKVALNQTEQKLSENALALRTATQDLEDARGQVKTAIGTIDREIKLRRKQAALLDKSSKRLAKVRASLAKQLGPGGVSDEAEGLYAKRLINRKTFTSSTLGVLEAEQRLTAIDNELELAKSNAEDMRASVGLLTALRDALKTHGPVEGLMASSPDLLLLTKQAVEARASEFTAQSRIATAASTDEQLERNRKVLSEQIAQIELSAVGRAIHTRIDVIFVPYTNTQRFLEGSPLYSCAFTIFWCKPAGTVGRALPGEINAVHPFFGKPIRGSFVEAQISNPDAATREIIHGTRSPFFL